MITILISLLLPVVTSARDRGNEVLCQNNLRRLWQGWLLFATDYENHLPGSRQWNPNSQPDYQACWCGGKYPHDPMMHPQAGTVFKYVNHDYRAYLCPSLTPGPPVLGDQTHPEIYQQRRDSNGRFDYPAFTTFAGCLISDVPNTATLQKSDGTAEILPTPILCEEEPKSLNGSSVDPGHSGGDQMAHRHHGGAYYVSPDGAVNWYIEPSDCSSMNWFAKDKGGKLVCMGAVNAPGNLWEWNWGWFAGTR